MKTACKPITKRLVIITGLALASILWLFLLGGCGTISSYEKQALCGHKAYMDAIAVAEDGHKVRFVMFDNPKGSSKHLQAQAKIDGEWLYLSHNQKGWIFTTGRDWWVKDWPITGYLDLNWLSRHVRRLAVRGK